MSKNNYSKKNEIRFSISLPESLIEQMESSFVLTGSRTRNAFIKEAIQFYVMYSQLKGVPDTFTSFVTRIVETSINNAVEKLYEQQNDHTTRLARNQFKIATELAKVALIIGDNLNIPQEKMTEWHVTAVEEVMSINGILDFKCRLEKTNNGE